MRSLTCDAIVCADLRDGSSDKNGENCPQRMILEKNLLRLKEIHHSQCLFNRRSTFIPDLKFTFDDNGTLHGNFVCNKIHQGYDTMVHGGVIAAIIDASMAQCLMGHGIAGYTTELSIKYRKPVFIDSPVTLKTSVKEVRLGCLYVLKTQLVQNRQITVTANAQFFKFQNHLSIV